MDRLTPLLLAAERQQVIMNSYYTPEEEAEALRLTCKSAGLFVSELWAGKCLNNLRTFKKFGKLWAPIEKTSKVMKRGNN